MSDPPGDVPPTRASTPLRVVCFSGYTDNLRARALADGLRDLGWDVTESRGRGRRTTAWEIVATVLPNCWLALTTRADLALGCKPHPNVSLPLAICRRRGIPTWLDVDDLDHEYRPGLAGRLVAWAQRPHPRRAELVTFHHPLLRDHLVDGLGCDPARTLAVPQGVHADRFARPRAPLARHDGRPRVVFAAHLNLACDLDVVLAAWPLVVARRPASVLTVVGGGARLAEFRRAVRARDIAGSVELVGEVRPDEVPAYLAGADVAVAWATDRRVNRHRCSLKLREYLAAGLPVVCNDVGELADFAAVTYQVPAEGGALADQIVRLLDGEGDGREDAGRRLAADLDWHPIVRAAAGAVAQRFGLAAPPGPPGAPGTASPPRPVAHAAAGRAHEGDRAVPVALTRGRARRPPARRR
jgi:glycosyltransferase involved in cell wall biosynthesis